MSDTPRTDAIYLDDWPALRCECEKLERELTSAQARIAELEGALARIEDMSVRAMCVCGVPTGTAAIQTVARRALERSPAGEDVL